MTVTDNNTDEGSSVFRFVVVYDPEGGFVTGGGWINSPAGAYVDDLSATGKATFGFVSKYKRGQTVPQGNTEFQFKAGDLNFHSVSYDWLVVAGPRVQFKGDGTINGAGNFGFFVVGTDGKLVSGEQPDRFRIKIWNKDIGDSDNDDALVYDNEFGDADDADPITEITGSIVIHAN